MTNGDALRKELSSMTDEELQSEFANRICNRAEAEGLCGKENYCNTCQMKWLKQECKDADND